MRTTPSYITRIWSARYFWIHLTKAELRIKFRRSALGMLWALLNPLLLTLLLSVVIGGMFKQEWKEFSPYVFSGIIVWEFVVTCVVAGSHSIINAEAYIKQFNHPLSIYTIKTVLVNFTVFLVGFLGLFLWILITKPQNFLVSLISLPLSFSLFFLIGWPIAMISSLIHTKFRDYQQMMVLLLQALYYVSPVFFEAKMFRAANLSFILAYNPITYIMNLLRQPLLYGKFPVMTDYVVVICTAGLLYLIVFIKIKREEKNIIYYI